MAAKPIRLTADQIAEAERKALALINQKVHYAYASTSNDAASAAELIIDSLLQKGAEKMYGKYLARRLPEHMAHTYAHIAKEVAVEQLRHCDAGECVDALVLGWSEEEEAKSSSLDSWAVQSLKAEIREGIEYSLADQSMSIQGSVHNTTRFSFMSTKNRPMTQQNRSAHSFRSEATFRRKVPEAELVQLDTSQKPETPDPIIDRMRNEREELARRQQQEAVIMRTSIKGDKLREAARNEVIKKLKDKQYTYEYDGKVLLTKDVEPNTLPNNETAQMNYNLNHPPEIATKFRYETKEIPDNRYGKYKISSTKKKEQKAPMPYVEPPALKDLIQPATRVKVKTEEFVKEGPPLEGNRMSREDYEKLSHDIQEKQRERYQQMALENARRLGPKEDLRTIQEVQVSEQIERAYSKTPERNIVRKATSTPGMKVHNQGQLVKMLVDEPGIDQQALEEQQKRVEQHQRKLQKQREMAEDEKRAKEILDRVSSYDRLPQRDGDGKKPIGLHKEVEKYNRKIMDDPSWGQPYIKTRPRGVGGEDEELRPQSFAEKKRSKTPIVGSGMLKNPRERQSPTQKAVLTNSSANNSRPTTTTAMNLSQTRSSSVIQKRLIEAKETEKRVDAAQFKRQVERSSERSTATETIRQRESATRASTRVSVDSQRAKTSQNQLRMNQTPLRGAAATEIPKIINLSSVYSSSKK